MDVLRLKVLDVVLELNGSNYDHQKLSTKTKNRAIKVENKNTNFKVVFHCVIKDHLNVVEFMRIAFLFLFLKSVI